MTSRFSFLHWLFAGGINPLAELGWAERRKHLLCPLSPLLFLRRRGGEERGAGSGTLRTLSLPPTNANTHGNMRSDLCLHHRRSPNRWDACMHACSGVPASIPAWVPHDTLKDGRPRSLRTCAHAEDAGGEWFPRGESRNELLLEAVKQESGDLIRCVLFELRRTWNPGWSDELDCYKSHRCFSGGPVAACVRLSLTHIHKSVRPDAPSAPYASDGANISPFQHLSGGNEWARRERWWRRRRERWRRRRPGGPIQEQKERKHPCEFGWEWTLCWKSERRGIASVFLSSYQSPSSTQDRITRPCVSLYTFLIVRIIHCPTFILCCLHNTIKV